MPGTEVVAVDADVHAVTEWLVVETTVHMAVQMPGAAIAAIPLPHRIMAQHDRLTPYGDLLDQADRGEAPGMATQGMPVVIGLQKMHLSIQPLEIPGHLAVVAEAEIAEMVDGIT